MRTFDARAWLIWLGVTAVLIMSLRNPLYTILLLLVAKIVQAGCSSSEQGVQLSLGRFSLTILTFSTLFNALSVHIGHTVLFRLPSNWWLIGGTITLEAAVFGAQNGLVLLTLLALFWAFNAILPVSELIQLTPRALREMGLVVVIAVTYIPETFNHLQRIREAQAIRGYQLRGLRDWRPLLLPLLVGGLERAMNLAEAMTARGYAAAPPSAVPPLLGRLGLFMGMLTSLVGWIGAIWLGAIGYWLMGLGVLILLLLGWLMGRDVRVTQYHTRAWGWRDTVVGVTAVTALLLTQLPAPFVNPNALTYVPYPALTLPLFDPLIGLAMMLLITPLLLKQE